MDNKNIFKTFNLEKERPKVLISGTGIVQCGGTSPNWRKIIEELAKDDISRSLLIGVPHSIQATIAIETDDEKRYNKYYNFFSNEYPYYQNDLLKEILQIPFDAILTTNYSYDIEYNVIEKFPYNTDSFKRKYGFSTINGIDKRYLLHYFYRLNVNDKVTQDIWHIHGEARKKTSMVLTHDEYAKTINAILNYGKMRKYDYEKNTTELKFESWVDYFIFGDLFIIGLGFDFSEFDLWWLINRRNREKSGFGNVYFFSPRSKFFEFTPIENALRNMGVNIEHCGITLSGDKEEDNKIYKEFYIRAIKKIKEIVNK